MQSWVSVRQWLEAMKYESLDAKSKDAAHGAHALHFVPAYGPDRYQQISQIPPYSGRSAYENDMCPSCEHQPVEEGWATCPSCNGIMRKQAVCRKKRAPVID